MPERGLRYLITGCSGFLGHHLAEFLLQKGHQVFGTFWSHPITLKGVTSLRCDFRSQPAVRRVVKRAQPNVIFHFAGQSNIPHSWNDFQGTFEINVHGTYFLLEAVKDMIPQARVVVVGSSSEYGPVKEKNGLLAENSPLHPTNPYALSKVAEDLLGWVYYRALGLTILRVIPFYVVGARKESDAPSDFAKAIVGHARGKVANLGVGNLAAIRDVVDIRDATTAFYAIGKKGLAGRSYNLCTGREVSLRDILRKMIAISGSPLKITTDPDKFRVADDTRIVGNPRRLKGLGWKPRFSLDETLGTMLDYWKRNI